MRLLIGCYAYSQFFTSSQSNHFNWVLGSGLEFHEAQNVTAIGGEIFTQFWHSRELYEYEDHFLGIHFLIESVWSSISQSLPGLDIRVGRIAHDLIRKLNSVL